VVRSQQYPGVAVARQWLEVLREVAPNVKRTAVLDFLINRMIDGTIIVIHAHMLPLKSVT
jgi:hypothetical protein